MSILRRRLTMDKAGQLGLDKNRKAVAAPVHTKTENC